jgi:hypothetical protein
VVLADSPASDLWSSNTMEARPFKDAAYELRRAQLHAAAQAVPRLAEAAVQVRACCVLRVTLTSHHV